MKKGIFSFLLALIITAVKSQASLGFTSHATPGLSDTILMGSNITYGVTVMNTGTQPLNITYTVYIGLIDTSSFFPTVVDSVEISNPLQAGDSVQVTITQNVSPAKFTDGNNTVVIWPAAPGYQTTDTIFKDVFILNFQETGELTENQIIIYPNPATDYIFIEAESKLESVRIRDVNVREVLHSKNNRINLSLLEAGIYFLEINFGKEKVIYRKIIIG